MSLKRKDASNNNGGGVRLAADCPHLVSFGSGRLSVAVTIHKIPFGHFTIGTSEHCGVIIQGSGIHPVHCSIFRHDNDTVSILPEKAARVLIDGIEIDEETNLSQGSMITIGKSNYLRFNNPAEAELIKSSMGSNERISMPQIDFSQPDSSSSGSNSDNSSASSTEASSPERVLNNLIETSSLSADKDKQQNINNFIDKLNKFDNIKNILSPKVFTDSVVTVNAPAKDVLGLKYNNFSKNLNTNCDKNVKNTNSYVNVVPQNNSNSNNSSKSNLKMNNHFVTKTEPPSALYDRYPKPGVYGSLKLYPVSTILINNSELLDQQEMSNKELEQAKLDEILNMCAEYEKQHQNQANNPPKTPTLMQQNRIKTNGSLPRDKKSAFNDMPTSPENDHQKTIPSSGYENVSFGKAGRMELSLNGSSHEENTSNHNNGSGYENVFMTKKYVPQSPRTRIKTCLVSPPTKKAAENTKKQNDYDLLIQSFEEKLKAEIKILKESSENRVNVNETNTNGEENGCKSLTELKSHRKVVLNEIRELKTNISDLQRQEEEILRELDMEKALVTAELCTENSTLMSLEKNLQTIQNKIYRMEAQRNASRVMQETQQAKLRQTMEVKQSQIDNLQQIMVEEIDTSIQDELNATINSLDNDKKNFEDLEFQYLEEEAEWMGHREELYNDLKTLTKHIDEIKGHIVGLKNQKVNNQQIACKDTKDLEQDILTAHQNLEKSREKLKMIDKEIALLLGNEANQDSEEEDDDDISPKETKMMSQSLFGSQEILSTAKQHKVDLMSMSMNECMFFSNIEMPSKSSTPKRSIKKIDVSHDITKLIEDNHDQLKMAEEDCKRDSILLLKYNLTPPYDHSKNDDEMNLSLNDDDFHMNLLDKRAPSQDDIDRISAVTTNSPITAPGSNFKVFESIKEIEKNRQRLLTLQGSHVIEHERQRMNELRKRSHDAAILQYSQLHSGNEHGMLDDYCGQNSVDSEMGKNIDGGENVVSRDETKTKFISGTSTLPKPSTNKMSVATNSLQRFSNPELDTVDTQQIFNRALTENNADSKDNSHPKQYKSNNDIRPSSFRMQEIENIDDKRNSTISESGSSDIVRRSIPKHQRPLTRYLPIMSSDLDLRQHIESAGHQIALCPHVIVDSTSCRGYLHKLGATFRGWSRRWFVLDREKRALIYYADKNAKKSRGGAYFTTIDEVYLDHLNESKSGRPHCTFIVKTKKRSYHLQAASDATARIWIDAIITGALGNIDY